jgi:hypothetical protein
LPTHNFTPVAQKFLRAQGFRPLYHRGDEVQFWPRICLADIAEMSGKISFAERVLFGRLGVGKQVVAE